MTARLTLLLRKVQVAMNDGKTFNEAIEGYRLTPAEVEELKAAVPQSNTTMPEFILIAPPWVCDNCGSPNVTTRNPVIGGTYTLCTACADALKGDNGQPIDWVKHNLRLSQDYHTSPNVTMSALILKEKAIDEGHDWATELAQRNLTHEERKLVHDILVAELSTAAKDTIAS